MYSTGLSGTLPQGITALVSLQELFISDTELSGQLPDQWDELGDLSYVDERGTKQE